MSSEIHLTPLAECRSFVAAFCDIPSLLAHTYLTREKKGDYYVYTRSFDKPGLVKTQQIFDAVDHCFTLLKDGQISEEERQALLKNLKKGLEGYERNLKAFFKVHWFRGLFSCRTFRRISHFHTLLKDVRVESLPPAENQIPSIGVKKVVDQIQSLFSTINSVKECQDAEQVASFAKKKIEQINSLREESILLPWETCFIFCSGLSALQLTLEKATSQQLFSIQQKKDIVETKERIEKIYKELDDIEAEFKRRLDKTESLVGIVFNAFWLGLTASRAVGPLKKNRFFKLSPVDSCSQEAIKVYRQIQSCRNFYLELLETGIFLMGKRYSRKRVPNKTNSQNLMNKLEIKVREIEEQAQGNDALLAAIQRFTLAKEKDDPELFFSLEKPSDLPTFEKAVKKAALLTHPDKNKNHEKAADTLFWIHNELANWIRQNKYSK